MDRRQLPSACTCETRLGKTIDEIWGVRESDANFAANSLAAAIRNLRDPEKALAALQPSTDQQRQALATAISTIEAIGQARLQMAFALWLRSPIRFC